MILSLTDNISSKLGVRLWVRHFAPAYANIYMAGWEQTAFPKYRLTPDHYFRFLDDIWGTWPYMEQDFVEFIQILNSHHPCVKVKYTLHHNSVDFLDTTTFKGSHFETMGTLDVKVFFEDTDTDALLHKTSHHPKHTFPAIVKSQLSRFHRICTHHDDFIEAKRILFKSRVGAITGPSSREWEDKIPKKNKKINCPT